MHDLKYMPQLENLDAWYLRVQKQLDIAIFSSSESKDSIEQVKVLSSNIMKEMVEEITTLKSENEKLQKKLDQLGGTNVTDEIPEVVEEGQD